MPDDPDGLDDLIRELGDAFDKLNGLPDDAFAERYELHNRQTELREQIARFQQDPDDGRSTDDLLRELANQRERLAAIERQRIDMVSQSGGGSASGTGSDGWGGVVLNQQIEAAGGAPEIRARIGRIKGILTDRGVKVPEAR